MQQEILTIIYTCLVCISFTTGIISYYTNKKLKLYPVSHTITFLYLVMYLIYLSNNKSIIVTYTDIEHGKYYGFINNSIIILNPDIFYLVVTIIYLSNIFIEHFTSSQFILIMWLCVNLIDQLISMLYYWNLKKQIGVYIISHSYGMISILSCNIIFIIIIKIFQELSKINLNSISIITIVMLIMLMFNIINIPIYNQIYNPLNVNIGVFMGGLFALIDNL